MAAPGAPSNWPERWRWIGRAIRRRCPRCGTPGIWESFTRTRPECPTCGLRFDRGESDYFYGAYLLNFLAAELLPVAAFIVGLIVTWPTPPWNMLTAMTVALAIISPILLYPTTKALWLAIDLILRPSER
jgi:uncharacterized protein (DUF983 family)